MTQSVFPTAGQMQAAVLQIAGAFASLSGQLEGYGYNAVNWFAAALWSGLAGGQAAATAIAAAVDVAVAARLKIAAPSGVRMAHGQNTFEGFLIPLRSGVRPDGLYGGTTGEHRAGCDRGESRWHRQHASPLSRWRIHWPWIRAGSCRHRS